MTGTVTTVIGNEYDEHIREALRDTLIDLGAEGELNLRGVAGSQDIESGEIKIDGRSLVVESETYVGLSLTGAEDLVRLVATEVAKRVAARQSNMISRTVAWSFRSPLALAEMKSRLDREFDEPWTEADSHYHGDYLARKLVENTVARIYSVGSGFVVNLRYRSMDNDASAADARVSSATSLLLDKVLPTVLAQDIVETEPLE